MSVPVSCRVPVRMRRLVDSMAERRDCPVMEAEGDPPKPETAAEARARMQSQRAARSVAREAELAAVYGDRVPGQVVIGASVGTTTVFVALTVMAVIWTESLEGPYLAYSFVAFLLGTGIFFVDLLLAASRSRTDAMGIGGLFFLADSAPTTAVRAMNWSLGIAVVASIVGALMRSQTAVIFGTLEPILPLALSGLWSVRHGNFPLRTDVPGGG